MQTRFLLSGNGEAYLDAVGFFLLGVFVAYGILQVVVAVGDSLSTISSLPTVCTCGNTGFPPQYDRLPLFSDMLLPIGQSLQCFDMGVCRWTDDWGDR